MPYFILILGALILMFGLYKFLMRANVRQIKALFLSIAALAIGIALFYMAITGRLAAALGLFVALSPVAVALIRARKQKDQGESGESSRGTSHTISSRKEALEVLGLDENADNDDIRRAYKKLMQKIHPDHEGSQWMAAKLNAAKDFLLKND
jgi:membrane protein implicated in regulation of membrane protease activity